MTASSSRREATSTEACCHVHAAALGLPAAVPSATTGSHPRQEGQGSPSALATGSTASCCRAARPIPVPADQPTGRPSLAQVPACQRKTRRKLWELSHKLHCPVIGTCLEVAELRKLVRSLGIEQGGVLTDYDVHVSFVSAADQKNRLSLSVHKALEKKFASHVKRFAKAKDAEQLAGLWVQALERGEVPGALWATLTHPRCDDELAVRVFEEVHMLSHQIGAGQRADLKRLAATETELASLQRDFDGLQRRTRRQLEAREQRALDLERALHAADEQRLRLLAAESSLRDALAALRARADASNVRRLEEELAHERRLSAEARHECDRWRLACQAAEGRIAELEQGLRERRVEVEILEQLVAQSLLPCDACGVEDCAARPDLRGRRILCVGGRTRLVEQYRELVARCNGQFEHHDGGIEDNRQRLDALLSSADAVVCATDCVSHDAYYRLKRFCKRADKPHVFLRSSGISTFARALYGMAS